MTQLIQSHTCYFPGCEILTNSQCSGCKEVYYCTRKHQKLHWQNHKQICKKTCLTTKETLAPKEKPIVFSTRKVTRNSSNLLSLSKDLLGIIFSHLTVKEGRVFIHINKELYQTHKNKNFLQNYSSGVLKLDDHELERWVKKFSDICIKYLDLGYSKLTTDHFLAKLMPITTLEKLDLTECRHISDEGLKHLAKHPNITSIILEGNALTGSGLPFLKKNPGLQNLRINDYSNTQKINPKILVEFLACHKESLIHLDISINAFRMIPFCVLLSLIPQMPLLKVLTIGSTSSTSDMGFSPLSPHPNLQDLTLSGPNNLADEHIRSISKLKLKKLSLLPCTDITKKGIEHIGKISTLEELQLYQCERIADEDFKDLINLRKLRIIDLSESSKVSNLTLSYLSLIPSLNEIDLTECSCITDKDLKNLQILPKLHYLNLYGCINITDKSLEYFANFPSLLYLELRGCKNITDSGLQKLQKVRPKLETTSDFD